MTNGARCLDCGGPIQDTELERVPCAACGSTKRALRADVTEALVIGDHILTKHRHPGGRRFRKEVTEGERYFRKEQRIDRIHQVVDRDADRYTKTIWHGRTGEVLRHTDEPLTRHVPTAVRRAQEAANMSDHIKALVSEIVQLAESRDVEKINTEEARDLVDAFVAEHPQLRERLPDELTIAAQSGQYDSVTNRLLAEARAHLTSRSR